MSPVWSLSLSLFSGRWGSHLLRRLEPQPNGVIASLSLAIPRGSLDPEEKVADMYGFETNGELTAVCNYLRTYGGYEIEQV